MKKIAFAFGLILMWNIPQGSFAQSSWKKDLLNYIQTKLSKPDGSYGWEEDNDSHLTPAFAITGILYNINALPANKSKLIEFIRTHHPQKMPYYGMDPSVSTLRNYTYEQIQSLLWLGGDISSFNEEVKNWKSQAGILGNHEGHGYGGLYQETMTPICSKLLGLTMATGPEFLKYLESCRRANGSFNNAPTSFGGDGNILNTYWSLYAQDALAGPKTLTTETIAWLQACQLKNGGFTHQPNPQIGVNDDVIYTWAGIKALKLLGGKPKDVQGTINYLISLRNADGGFGDRPGLHSTPVASFYAIDALKDLGAISALDKSQKPKAVAEARPDFSGHKIYTVQFEAQGQGSPQEAVMLADSLNIDLWGVKYPVDGWVAAAQKIANERKVPVTFFISDEPHDNLLTVPGMGSFDHVLDYIAPAIAPVHFNDASTFDQLNNTVMKELKTANGGLILQVSNNEPLVRILLDESINNSWYLAISTVHFSQNYMVRLSYLAEYRYRLPMITLQDAHGTEAWTWADELTNHRTLFIAREPTYNEMVKSLKNNWVVAVRHDSVTNYKTNMFGSTEYVRKFISSKEAEWKWWGAANKSNRPQAAITVLSKDTPFESGKPESGLNIRVRTRWNSVRQTLKSRAVQLEQLKVDGQVVITDIVNIGRGAVPSDSYYLYKWGEPSKGSHTIEAVVKDIKTGQKYTYNQTFIQN